MVVGGRCISILWCVCLLAARECMCRRYPASASRVKDDQIDDTYNERSLCVVQGDRE